MLLASFTVALSPPLHPAPLQLTTLNSLALKMPTNHKDQPGSQGVNSLQPMGMELSFFSVGTIPEASRNFSKVLCLKQRPWKHLFNWLFLFPCLTLFISDLLLLSEIISQTNHLSLSLSI
jgi:hypothetical protein